MAKHFDRFVDAALVGAQIAGVAPGASVAGAQLERGRDVHLGLVIVAACFLALLWPDDHSYILGWQTLITAPLLWVEGDLTDITKWWGHRYPRSDFEARLAVVPSVQRERLSPCGHMLHHDQPEALARALRAFLA